MKRNTIVKIILLIYFIPMFLPAIMLFFGYGEDSPNNSFDYARITDVDYRAELVDEPGSNGKVVITEKLTFDIHAASRDNLFWELWRDLPEDYIDGVKVDYQVNSVKQILDNGEEIIYDESSKLYWDDDDYTNTRLGYGPEKWYHSEGPYNENARDYECLMLYIDGVYRDEMVFEIEYEMNNAALRYNDCSELYLSMYSEETIKYLESFKAEILIPDEDMPDEDCYEAHTYGTNSNEFDFTESTRKNPGYHTFSIELDESDLQFKPYNQYLEFDLLAFGKDKHEFTDYASINNYYYDDVLEECRQEQEEYENAPKTAKKNKGAILFFSIIAAIFILYYPTTKLKQLKKKYNFYTPSMKFQYFRDIPSNLDPTFASALVFCKDKPNDISEEYSAIMLSLVRKGYIELDRIDDTDDWSFDNIKIIIKYNPVKPTILENNLNNITNLNDNIISEKIETIPTETIEEPTIPEKELEPLTTTEELYFNLIVRHSGNNELSMKKFQTNISADISNTDTFVRNMENSITTVGISQGYFQKADYEEPKKILKSKANSHMILGIILLTLVNIISFRTRLDLAFGAYTILGIVFLISSRKLKKLSKDAILLTQYGEDEYEKWRGLYNFLNSQTLINERTVIELPLWEQYLVYATAFGISDKVINALKIRCSDLDNSEMLRNPYYRSRSFYSSSRAFRTSVRSASHIYRAGSYGGYGGHGGYGGGGRGGGGGRRRTLGCCAVNS